MGETKQPLQRLTYSVSEAAEVLGVSPRLVYELVRSGQLAAVRLGRRIVVPRHIVESLVAESDATGQTA